MIIVSYELYDEGEETPRVWMMVHRNGTFCIDFMEAEIPNTTFLLYPNRDR